MIGAAKAQPGPATLVGLGALGAVGLLGHVLGLVLVSELGQRLLGLERGPALRLQLGLWSLAGLCWLAGLWLWRRAAASGGWSWRSVAFVGALAILMRLPALVLPIGVVHSNDVYRYFWDGAVQRAGLDPYAGSPESPIYDAVRRDHPDLYEHINHRHLPTIYPPVAQAAFNFAVRLAPAAPLKIDSTVGGALWRWRAVCGAGELGLLLLLGMLLGRAGVDRRWVALPALCPLPVIELWVNAHADWLGLLLLAAALRFWPREGAYRWAKGSALVGGALLMLAMLVKPLAGAVLPALLRRRLRSGLLVAMAVGALLAAAAAWWPYRAAGLHVMPSLGEYGRRWRSNDGAYALVHRAAESIVQWRFQPPAYLPWEPWQSPRLAQFVTGRDRDTVFPDELANFFARAFTSALLLGLVGVGLRLRLAAPQLGLLLLSGYALLTPTLHPWYLLWPLLLAPLWLEAAAPVLILTALAPIAYVPLPAEWAGQGHHEPLGWRLVEHGLAWLAVAFVLMQFYRRRGAARLRRDIARTAQAV